MATAQDLLKLANRHLGEQYTLGAFAPKDNPNWKGPWDCAEFVSWVMFQITGLLLGCTSNSDSPSRADAYSGAWARDATAANRPVSIGQAKATPGAVLVRKPAPKGIGHVSISRGDGTTIEAHSARLGVTNHRIDGRRWDLAMLLPLIEYGELPEPAVVSPPSGIVLRTSTSTPGTPQPSSRSAHSTPPTYAAQPVTAPPSSATRPDISCPMTCGIVTR